MKKVFMSALVICAMSMSSVAFAQECKKDDCTQQDKAEFMQKRCTKMVQELNLTDEQIEQIKASKEEMNKEKKGARQSVDAARKKHQENIDKILTPEQKAKMQEMRKQRPDKKEMRHHRGMHKMGKDSMRPCPEMRGKNRPMRNDSCCVEKPCEKMNK